MVVSRLVRHAGVVLSLVLCATSALGGTVQERRLPYAPTPAEIAAEQALRKAPITPFAAQTFLTKAGTPVRYRLLTPATPPGDGRLPLVLVLPSSGGIGTDNTNQLGPFAKSWAEPAVASRFPAYVVVPQVAARSAVYSQDKDGMRASRPGESLPPVLEMVDDLVARLPVDPSRLYLVGFSMGASSAFDAAVLQPRRFAAVAAFSGVPPRRSLAAKVAHVPMLLVHGTADRNNPFDADRAWAAALAAAGASPILEVHDGMDHRVAPSMYTAPDWRDWLFAQRAARD